MLINIISQGAEEQLLAHVERSNQWNMASGALHFQCSKLPRLPSEEDLLLTVRPVLEDKSAALYLFQDGDVVITWHGTQKSTLEMLSERLYERYSPHTDKTLHHYYDLQAHGEDLRLLCKKRKANTPADTPAPAGMKAAPASFPTGSPGVLTLLPEQVDLFHATACERKNRINPEILIVEDQVFSVKMLLGLLDNKFKTHTAVNAEMALKLYCTNAPDIVFLDIELPDANGHDLAVAIYKLDAQGFIVMVTGNHYAKDVARAKVNGAKGFIVKPYSKQKIMEAIQKFQREQQQPHRRYS